MERSPRTIKLVELLLFSSLLFADLSGFFYFSSFRTDFQGQRDLLLFSALRLRWEGDLGPLRFKFVPQLVGFSLPSYYLPLITGYDLEEGNPLYFYKGGEDRAYLLVDRASLSFSAGRLSVTVGRDRFAWGKARMFSLMDIFNPYNPFSLFPERQGVDGGRLRFYLSDFSWAEAVWVRRKGESSYGAGIFFPLSSFDLQISAGRSGGKFLGLAFEGDLGGIGLRGELFKKEGFSLEYVLGADYQLTGKIYVMGEYLRSKGSLYPPLNLLTLGGEFDITPLLRAEVYFMRLSGGSYFIFSNLKYSAAENLDVNLGLLVSSSKAPWPMPNISSLSWKLYF